MHTRLQKYHNFAKFKNQKVLGVKFLKVKGGERTRGPFPFVFV